MNRKSWSASGTRPSSEGFVGATSCHPHGNTVECGAIIIPPISQGTEEGDGLPKVTLEVSVGTESQALAFWCRLDSQGPVLWGWWFRIR